MKFFRESAIIMGTDEADLEKSAGIGKNSVKIGKVARSAGGESAGGRGRKRGTDMLSMTGYGKGEYKAGGIELTCEVKSVNNRYLDVAVKVPKLFLSREDVVRSLVREKVSRGHVDVFVSFKDKRERPAALTPDLPLASAYVAAARALSEAIPSLADDLTLSSVLRWPDVLRQDEAASADDELFSALESALKEALDALNRMRAAEGEKLRADLSARGENIAALVEKIAGRAPSVAEEYREKLTARVREYLKDVKPDESRLLTEVAAFSDRSNIDEEITRLRSHLVQFKVICAGGTVGRKLDFLVQEFNREANTICSKSNDIEITRLGLELKNEIEKVREQVQNIE